MVQGKTDTYAQLSCWTSDGHLVSYIEVLTSRLLFLGIKDPLLMEAAHLFAATQTRNDHTEGNPTSVSLLQALNLRAHQLVLIFSYTSQSGFTLFIELVPNNPGWMFSTSPLESGRNLISVPAFSGILQQLFTYHVPPLTKLTNSPIHSQVLNGWAPRQLTDLMS